MKTRILLALLLCLSLVATAFMFGSCGGDTTTTDETTADTTAAEETTAAETEAPKVTAFEITTPPTKTEYKVGEELDLTGMVCTVTYDDGTTAEYTDYKVSVEGPLKPSDTTVTIRYSSRYRATLEIKVKLEFEGEGTYENPYIIATPADFLAFIAGCESQIATGSSDIASSFGAKTFFKQTADIDLTGSGFAGTIARSDPKYAFGGVYDGCGHTLTVNLESTETGDISVFPYITGVVMNLKVEGTLNAPSSSIAQPFRTIGEQGGIINVYNSLDVYCATDANSFAVTLYGMAYNCYTDGILGGSSNDIFNSLKDTGTYVNVFHNCARKDGRVVESKSGSIQNTDLNDVVTKFNDTAAMANAVARLKTFNENYSEASLLPWEVVEGAIGFKK